MPSLYFAQDLKAPASLNDAQATIGTNGQQTLDFIANRLKAIGGKPSWADSPDRDLNSLINDVRHTQNAAFAGAPNGVAWNGGVDLVDGTYATFSVNIQAMTLAVDGQVWRTKSATEGGAISSDPGQNKVYLICVDTTQSTNGGNTTGGIVAGNPGAGRPNAPAGWIPVASFTVPAGATGPLNQENIIHEPVVGLFNPGKDSVSETALANGSVTTNKLADGAVTNGKIGADAVNQDKIADNSVRREHILDGEVLTNKLENGAVTGGKLAAGAVDNASKFLGGVVDNAALGDNSVSTGKIQDGAVTTGKIGNSQVTSAKVDLAGAGWNFTTLQKGGADVATEAFVNATAQGLKVKVCDRAMAVGATLPAFTFDGGTKRITATANGQLSVDGAPVGGGTFLVWNETGANKKYNGIWNIIDGGGAEATFILERTVEADAASEFGGQLVFVSLGNTMAGARVLCSQAPGTLNTDDISYTQLSDPAVTYTNGDGLNLVANQFSVDVADLLGEGIEDDGSNNFRVKLDGTTLGRSADGIKVLSITDTEVSATAAIAQTKIAGLAVGTDPARPGAIDSLDDNITDLAAVLQAAKGTADWDTAPTRTLEALNTAFDTHAANYEMDGDGHHRHLTESLSGTGQSFTLSEAIMAGTTVFVTVRGLTERATVTDAGAGTITISERSVGGGDDAFATFVPAAA